MIKGNFSKVKFTCKISFFDMQIKSKQLVLFYVGRHQCRLIILYTTVKVFKSKTCTFSLTQIFLFLPLIKYSCLVSKREYLPAPAPRIATTGLASTSRSSGIFVRSSFSRSCLFPTKITCPSTISTSYSNQK